jgi:glyoxylase I family protein
MAISIQGMAPLLYVFDMQRSLDFYCKKIGFELAATDGNPDRKFNWVLLKLDGQELTLNTMYNESRRPTTPDAARERNHLDTEVFFGCPDVDTAHEHLRLKGVEAEKPWVTHSGFKRFWLKDPDGDGLVFHWKAH